MSASYSHLMVTIKTRPIKCCQRRVLIPHLHKPVSPWRAHWPLLQQRHPLQPEPELELGPAALAEHLLCLHCHRLRWQCADLWRLTIVMEINRKRNLLHQFIRASQGQSLCNSKACLRHITCNRLKIWCRFACYLI